MGVYQANRTSVRDKKVIKKFAFEDCLKRMRGLTEALI